MKQFKHVVATFLLGLALVMAVMAGFLGLAVEPTHADGPDEGYVVVVFPGEQATVRPISFTTSISLVGALKATDWTVVTDSSNNICSIEGVGCPASNCFCPDNWWSAGKWNSTTNVWDMPFPLPNVSNGEIAGFRWSNTAWGAPLLPGPVYTAANSALDWLKTQQSATDGSTGDMNSSVEVLMALGANKLKGNEWGNPSLFSYIFGNMVTFTNRNGVGAAGKTAVGVTAEGSCWLREAKTPLDYYNADTGRFSAGSLYHSWGILGTRALSQPVPAKAIEYLQSLQKANGGWAWGIPVVAPDPDTNSTAVAIQALLAAGESVGSTAVVSGLTYLDNAQNNDGGFPYDPNSSFGTTSDTNSTAYVVQALLAAGEVLTSTRWITGTGATPISYLLNRQLPDGSFAWQAGLGSNQSATQQAVPALLGQPFPLRQVELKICPSTFLPLIVKN